MYVSRAVPTPTTPLTLAQYQNMAQATAMQESRTHHYLVHGIVGEVGELFGQVAKAAWHHSTEEQLQAELVSEYGDVCWMTAMLLHGEGVYVVRPPQRMDWHGVLPNPWSLLLSRASQLHSAFLNREDFDWVARAGERMWEALHTECQVVTGQPFDTVLRANADKLAARAARGTLVGRGDHR